VGECVIPSDSYEGKEMSIRAKEASTLKVKISDEASKGLGELLREVAKERPYVKSEYRSLVRVFDDALEQAQGGKGIERHAGHGERFEDQQIVQLGEWMGSSTVFAIGQACKKSIESTRLPDDRARAELLGAINYLAAAVLVIDRRKSEQE
jgi:hypothetical protein